MRKGILWASAAATGVTAYWLATSSRAFIEKAGYNVLRTDGPFEVRDYPALCVASAAMPEGEPDGAFRRLFRFISRGNARGEKIAMTAPVFIDRAPEPGKMSFVMPREMPARSVPQPTDDGVTLGQRPAERVAVYRYPGRSSAANERKALQALREWMRANGIEEAGAPVAAYYDAPFLPPLLRRNEMMLRVKPAA